MLVAAGTYLMLFYHFSPASTDEGIIATGAERILRGQIPFRDFFSELGPGSFYLQAAIFKLAGISISSFRFTAWTGGTILTGLIYFLGKRALRGPAAYAPPFIFAATCFPFAFFVSHHWWAVLFFLLMLICMSTPGRLITGAGPSHSPQGLLAAGVLAGLTLLCMQPTGASSVALGPAYFVLAAKLPKGRKWSDAIRAGLIESVWFLTGAGIVIAFAACYFWRHAALRDWSYDNFTFLFANYSPYQTAPGVYSWARFAHVLQWLIDDHSFQSFTYFVGFYFYALVGPVIGCTGALHQIRQSRATDPSRACLLLLFLLAAVGALAAELHEAGVLHLIWASPMILILVVNAWSHPLKAGERWRKPLMAVTGLVLVAVIVVAARRLERVSERNAPVFTRRGTIYDDPEGAAIEQKWINAIEQTAPAGGSTFFFPYHAQLYFLTATRNPTRYDVLLPDFQSQKQFKEAIDTLRSLHPKSVFSFDMLLDWSPRAHYPDDPPDFIGPDSMEKSLQAAESPYQKTADVEGMEVWTLKK